MYRAFSGTAVKEGAFEEIKLSDYLGKWVILVFYPMVSLSPIILRLSCLLDVGMTLINRISLVCGISPHFRHVPLSK